jgi:hypothetical protein
MATVRTADNYANPMPDVPYAGVPVIRDFSYANGVALIINDTIKLGKLLANTVLSTLFISVPDMDTATAFACSLGDGLSAARFLSASTKGQAAASISITDLVLGTIPIRYTADDDLIFKVATAATTATTTGVLIGWYVFYNIGVASNQVPAAT